MKSNEAVQLTVQSAITWAQARADLNKTMLKLRTTYGFAPDKDITVAEMDERCNELVKETHVAITQYIQATGKAPDRVRNLNLYKTSNAFPQKKYEGLQSYANVPDEYLKRAPLFTSEAIGNLLDFNAEYLIRIKHIEAVRNRTRKEWQRLEYEYVERSDYNLRDLYDDLMKLLDAPVDFITVEEYQAERKKWKRCKYYACDNYFPTTKDHYESLRFKQTGIKTRRPNAQYCCNECKKAQENAEARFRKTGTYLPEDAYQYILEDSREKKEKSIKVISPEKIVQIIDKKQ